MTENLKPVEVNKYGIIGDSCTHSFRVQFFGCDPEGVISTATLQDGTTEKPQVSRAISLTLV